MKVAAIQITADLAEVKTNMNKARALAEKAFQAGAEWVILPEFFTSAVGFTRKMKHAAQALDGPAMDLLKSLARAHDGVVGGSYISWKNGDCYNTFVLAMPDGTTFFHDKDLPTMWENCYYVGGSDDGVLKTPSARAGVALCWEFIRTQTARRLINRVDLVVGGSCWWTLPEKRLPGFPKELHDKNLAIMKATIPRFARMLGVPVIHAAHAGKMNSGLPMVPGFPYRSYFLGETQIVDGTGKQLARMSHTDGEGFITADIDVKQRNMLSESIPDSFWIPDLPVQLKMIWAFQDWHGRRYYRKKTRPLMQKQFKDINK